MATTAKITAEEYFATTEEVHGMELIDGVVVVNEPRALHQRLAVRLVVAISNWISAEPGRGEVFIPIDVTIGEHDVYGPDVSYFTEARRPRDLEQRVDRLPDLCVEIRSPSTWRYDVGHKKAMYEQQGLRELWLVDDGNRAVLVFRRSKRDSPTFDVALEFGIGDTLGSPLLPGFVLPVADLFAR